MKSSTSFGTLAPFPPSRSPSPKTRNTKGRKKRHMFWTLSRSRSFQIFVVINKLQCFCLFKKYCAVSTLNCQINYLVAFFFIIFATCFSKLLTINSSSNHWDGGCTYQKHTAHRVYEIHQTTHVFKKHTNTTLSHLQTLSSTLTLCNVHRNGL